MRVYGELLVMELPTLSAENTEHAAKEILPPSLLESLRRRGDAETALSFDGLGRYRVNVYRQRR
jgi:twitching motility protein PilT